MSQQIKVETTPGYATRDVGDFLFGYHIAVTTPDSPQMILDVPDDRTPEQALADLRQRGAIVDGRRVHDDYTVLGWPVVTPAAGAVAVGDTFPLQGLTESNRERGRYGAGVIVGLADTGLDAQHVAFRGKDVRGDLTDSHGHGTHTASTAASAWGIASDATILMAAVLPGGTGTEAGVATGIRTVAEQIAAARAPGVLSLSLGGSPSQVIDAACTYARQLGVPVVAAAGNTPNAAIGSPARAADLIVLAVDRQRQYAPFTSGTGWGNPNRVSAMGVEIAAAGANTGDGVLVMSGTSMSCPQIAGMLAIWLGATT